MSSVERTPTSVEVGAVVVETSAQKSAASKEWAKELVRDGDRKARALKRSETFKADQRFFQNEMAKMLCPASCGLCSAFGAQNEAMNHRQLEKCTGQGRA